ncbi:hypothetical protein LZ31DRAFT_550053 [Colletotrichum somersetense]|nr:hypothetical protein LZ31DRAFT_550053 [Colletotrichum somersetense]
MPRFMVVFPILIFVFTFLAGLLGGFVPRYRKRSYAYNPVKRWQPQDDPGASDQQLGFETVP